MNYAEQCIKDLESVQVSDGGTSSRSASHDDDVALIEQSKRGHMQKEAVEKTNNWGDKFS